MGEFKLMNNHGVLFKNKFQKHDKQPFMQGHAIVDGKEYKVKAWDKFTKDKEQYISFCLELIEEPKKAEFAKETTEEQQQAMLPKPCELDYDDEREKAETIQTDIPF